LYCYRCTKKLGLNAWEMDGKYYCEECKVKRLISL
jgi:DNA-directed RNA polymerase subunit RPC12/RpoP